MLSLIGTIIMTVLAIVLNVFNNSDYAFDLRVNSNEKGNLIHMLLDSDILDYICQYTNILAVIFGMYFITNVICKKHKISTRPLDIFEFVTLIVFIGSYTIFIVIGFVESIISGGEFFGNFIYILIIAPFLAVILLCIWVKRLYNKFLKKQDEIVVNETNVIKNIFHNVYSRKIVTIPLVCIVTISSIVAVQQVVFIWISEDVNALIGLFVINPILVIWLDIYCIVKGIYYGKNCKKN